MGKEFHHQQWWTVCRCCKSLLFKSVFLTHLHGSVSRRHWEVGQKWSYRSETPWPNSPNRRLHFPRPVASRLRALWGDWRARVHQNQTSRSHEDVLRECATRGRSASVQGRAPWRAIGAKWWHWVRICWPFRQGHPRNSIHFCESPRVALQAIHQWHDVPRASTLFGDGNWDAVWPWHWPWCKGGNPTIQDAWRVAKTSWLGHLRCDTSAQIRVLLRGFQQCWHDSEDGLCWSWTWQVLTLQSIDITVSGFKWWSLYLWTHMISIQNVWINQVQTLNQTVRFTRHVYRLQAGLWQVGTEVPVQKLFGSPQLQSWTFWTGTRLFGYFRRTGKRLLLKDAKVWVATGLLWLTFVWQFFFFTRQPFFIVSYLL